MNNCPKCGNPLQPGTVNCPICGTNINQPNMGQPAVGGMPINAMPQPQMPMANQAPMGMANAMPMGAQAPIQAPSSPMTNGVSQPGLNQMNQVSTTPPTPGVSTPGVGNNGGAVPSATGTASGGATSATSSSSGTTNTPAASTVNNSANSKTVGTAKDSKAKKEKKPLKINKGILIGGIVAAVVVIGVVVFLLINKGSETKLSENKTTPTPSTVASATSKTIVGNFSFSLPNNWSSVQGDYEEVYVSNKDESAIAELATIYDSLSDVDGDLLKKEFENVGMSEVNIVEMNFAKGKGFFVEGILQSNNVEFYYIPDNNVTIIVAAVYMSKDDKTKYSPDISTVVNSLVYQDDIKAIESFGMYDTIFDRAKNISLPTNSSSESGNSNGSSSDNEASFGGDSSNSSSYGGSSSSSNNNSSYSGSSSNNSSSSSSYNDDDDDNDDYTSSSSSSSSSNSSSDTDDSMDSD